mmetsp:Transcript_14592/g.27741  ORF Transcript_14592/g.27741 Transcript_14592/m.27741 type:complete len:153 (-) Transcript_14592:44-502(-)
MLVSEMGKDQCVWTKNPLEDCKQRYYQHWLRPENYLSSDIIFTDSEQMRSKKRSFALVLIDFFMVFSSWIYPFYRTHRTFPSTGLLNCFVFSKSFGACDCLGDLEFVVSAIDRHMVDKRYPLRLVWSAPKRPRTLYSYYASFCFVIYYFASS